ncbi:unnamed protein product [marine sediment metagenome]|uniref:Arc-like DNA binding domain-containing protein n=1 Tax=marine sediment metagenome TaxID=412755 RepID=X1FJ96_9ZZZZ
MVKETRMTLRLPSKTYGHLRTESKTTNVSLNGTICNILARYFGLTSEKWNKHKTTPLAKRGEKNQKQREKK